MSGEAAVYPKVLDELAPAACHRTEQYANNRLEADHGQLKRRLRPMRGLKTDLGGRIVIAGHALVQNIRRGHYELAVDQPARLRIAVAQWPSDAVTSAHAMDQPCPSGDNATAPAGSVRRDVGVADLGALVLGCLTMERQASGGGPPGRLVAVVCDGLRAEP